MLIKNIRRVKSAFTLIELLVVIAIIGILAAIAVPTMNSFKPNVMAAATQQLLTDIARARQLAISERTTVYMVFLPTNIYSVPQYSLLTTDLKARANKLADKQLIAYNYVAVRALGDQPGSPTPRYLGSWRTLPEGTFIPLWKFYDAYGVRSIQNPLTTQTYLVRTFETNAVPFPTAASKELFSMPSIAFDYRGQLVPRAAQRDYEIIPLARGSVSFSRAPDRVANTVPPTLTENPVGNSTNAFNLIYIDRLTGRSRSIRQEVP